MKPSLFIFTLIILSCNKKAKIDTFDCASLAPTYNGQVKALMDKYCATAGCHDATTAASGTNLSDYANVKTHAGHDHFLGSIQQKSGYPAMPKGGNKLSDDDIKTISCWVQNGKPQ